MTSPEKLKALSIRQPWAELILRGEKAVEYRSQPTRIRGRIYIYAAVGKSNADETEFEEEIGCPLAELPRGVVVGTVEIVDCAGVDGEYEWLLANPQRLPEPLSPHEHPQPIWFHPFGRPDDVLEGLPEPQSPGDLDAAPASDVDDSQAGPTAIRFAPVLAAAKEPPFTPYHAKYLAYELTKRLGADQADKLAQSL